MKHYFRAVILGLVSVSLLNADETGKHLFILSGQSNMVRLKEESTFIPSIEQEFGAGNVIIVKDAKGGQPIRRWYEGWEGPDNSKQEIGDLYDQLIKKVRSSIVGKEITTVTFLWMQGERDAGEPTGHLYRSSLEGLFRQLEEDLGRNDVNFVIGRLSDFGLDQTNRPYWTAIRKAQVELAETSSRIKWVDTDDLNDGANKKGEQVHNDLHYTKAGYDLFGRRLAEAAIHLVQQQVNRTEYSSFPSVDELELDNELPNPFQFYNSDRTVKNREDWEERRKEILKMVEFYSAGPAFPQTHNSKVVSLESAEVFNGRATHYKASMMVGPAHSIKYTFEFVLPESDGASPLLFYICPRKEYADEAITWREKIINRGYAFAWLIPGQFNGYDETGPVKDAFPEVKGNTMMAWIWGINEAIHYLDENYEISQLIVTGTSRFGKTAAMAGANNERIDLTVPVTGGFGVRRFNGRDQKQPASAFAGRCWSNDVFPTFAGQLNKMPIDQHFVGALIAPRALLAIMGAENDDKNEGHIEAYEALVPVYEWLGAGDKLGLYDHSPLGHGLMEEDISTMLDFADKVFFGKIPVSGKAFDQISNPEVIGFNWTAPSPN